MPIYAYVTDLLFSTKITSTGQALGVPVTVARSVDALAAQMNAAGVGDAHLVIVDLNASGDPLEAIRRMKAQSAPPRVIAYVSHVQADLAAAARTAGADDVMPRSAFSKNLPAILTGATASSSENQS
jgi:DNA-binding NarL/FixJ family response regulator